jgi:hypothetical protein
LKHAKPHKPIQVILLGVINTGADSYNSMECVATGTTFDATVYEASIASDWCETSAPKRAHQAVVVACVFYNL